MTTEAEVLRLQNEVERLTQENDSQRQSLVETDDALAAMTAERDEALSHTENWPCIACGYGHSAACDKGFETELRERAEAAEAQVARLQQQIISTAWVRQTETP